MVINGWAAVIYWRTQGISFQSAFLLLTFYWSFTLILTYYGTDLATYLLKKLEPFKVLIEISKEVIRVYSCNPVYKKRKKVINWLSQKKAKIVFSLAFIPLPELPTATIVAARVMKLKYALFILLLGNAFRVLVMCSFVYFFPSIFN